MTHCLNMLLSDHRIERNMRFVELNTITEYQETDRDWSHYAKS